MRLSNDPRKKKLEPVMRVHGGFLPVLQGQLGVH